jgi:dTDP-4-amino-4,6-dideoxygalactose transaminase
LVKALRAEGIASNVYYDPVHLQPYFSEMGYRKGINPVAETCGETVLSLPIFSEMQLSDINDIGDALGKITGLSANV